MVAVTRLLPAVLHAAQLPLTELCVARLDGEVYAVDECFAPIDEVEDATTRALALKALVGDNAVAERESALWIYGVRSSPPLKHTLCVPRTNRAAPARTKRAIVRETRLRADDTRQIGGLQVTSPVRTAFDLLRSETFTEVERCAIAALFERFDVDADACRLRIDSVANLPGRTRALIRLAQLVGTG